MTAFPAALPDRLARHPARAVPVDPGQVPFRNASGSTVQAVANALMSCREAGAGPAVVLLHGISGGSGSWIFQLEALSERFRVVAWDAPGYGGSDALTPPSPAAAEYADALGRLVDALDITEPFLLVGQSLGALIAASFASHAAQRLRGLLLLGPANGYGRSPEPLRTQKLTSRLEAMEQLGPEKLAEARADALVAPAASAEARAVVRSQMAALRPDGFAQAARLLSGGWLMDDAVRFPGPALIACGSEDAITPPAGCREIAQAFPRGEFALLPRVGHAAYAEDAAAVNELITGFAARCGLLRS